MTAWGRGPWNAAFIRLARWLWIFGHNLTNLGALTRPAIVQTWIWKPNLESLSLPPPHPKYISTATDRTTVEPCITTRPRTYTEQSLSPNKIATKRFTKIQQELIYYPLWPWNYLKIKCNPFPPTFTSSLIRILKWLWNDLQNSGVIVIFICPLNMTCEKLSSQENPISPSILINIQQWLNFCPHMTLKWPSKYLLSSGILTH